MIVLDASAAVQIANESQEGERLKRLMLSGETCIAPDLFYPEVANAFAKYYKAGLLNKREAMAYTAKAVCLVQHFIPCESLYTEALSEAMRVGHTVYDLLYLVLARRRGAVLFTLDKKLRHLAVENGVDVVESYDIDGKNRMIRSETKNLEEAVEAGWITVEP